MRKPVDERMRAALLNRGMRENTVRAVLNEALNSGVNTPDYAQQWSALRASVTGIRDSMQSNRKRWPAPMIPLYEGYLSVIRKVIAHIDKARAQLAPRAANAAGFTDLTSREVRLPITLAQYSEMKGGTHNAKWQSWVPDPVRKAFLNEFYAIPNLARGRRLIPFAPAHEIRANQDRLARAQLAIANTRAAYAVPGSDPLVSNSIAGAIHLAACRQAERAINKYARRVPMAHPYEDPAPVNWMHWLEPGLRARLRDARENPHLAEVDGVQSFYAPSVAH